MTGPGFVAGPAGGAARGVVAVVVAGGASRRYGADKLGVQVDGVSLRQRALDAVPAGLPVVVAGPERGGGPAAALLAALTDEPAAAGASWALVLAADQPFAAPAVTRLLAVLAAHPHTAGVIGVDPSGHRQPLLAVYAVPPLLGALRALPDAGHGAGLLRSVADLDLVDVPVDAAESLDVDTPDDLASAQRWAARLARGADDGER